MEVKIISGHQVKQIGNQKWNIGMQYLHGFKPDLRKVREKWP